MKLVLDESINPEFGTYNCKFNIESHSTEVWTSKSTQSFGIEQEALHSIYSNDVIIFNKEELLILQKLVNQAVEILEGKDENTI